MRWTQYNYKYDTAFDLVAFLALVMAAALLTIGLTLRADPACRAPIEGHGQAGARLEAQALARSDWAREAAAVHGPALADYWQAELGGRSCDRVSAGGWACRVKAKPCLRD